MIKQKYQRLLTYFLILLFAPAMAVADEKTNVVLLSKTTESGIRLKWMPKDLSTDYTYTLTRITAMKPDAKGQPEPPVTLGTFSMKTLEELKKTLPAEQVKKLTPLLYPQSLYKTDFEKLRVLAEDENRKGMLFFLAETRRDLMGILGITFEDKTAVKPNTYIYTIQAKSGNIVVATTSIVAETKKLTRVNVPQAEAVRYKWGAALKWTNFDTYAAFHIYRATKEKGPFTRITKTPVGVNYQLNEARQVVTAPYFHSDTTLDEGKLYYYKVSGIDTFGDETPKSHPVFAVRDSARRPAPMGIVTTTPGDKTVTLSWHAKEEGVKFNLFRGYQSNGTFEKINSEPIDKTSYTDTDVVYNKDYFYSVTAIRDDGTESIMSPPTHFPCRDFTPPEPPTGIRGVSKAGEVILEWNAVTAKDLAGYSVYRAYAANEPDWSRLTTKPQTPLIFVDTISKAMDKQSFFYKIQAKDKNGNTSDWSEILEIKLPDVIPPLPPVWSDWKQENGAVTLNWLKSKAPDTEGYLIYKGKGNLKKCLTPEPVKTTRFTDLKIIEGKKLTYFLVAVDTSKNKSAESSPLGVNTLDNTPPKISKLSITSEKGRVLINAAIRDPDFKAMSIQRKRTKKGEFKTIRSMLPNTKWTDKRVNTGTQYSYRIVVYDQTGNMTTSAEQNVIVTP